MQVGGAAVRIFEELGVGFPVQSKTEKGPGGDSGLTSQETRSLRNKQEAFGTVFGVPCPEWVRGRAPGFHIPYPRPDPSYHCVRCGHPTSVFGHFTA